MPDVVRAQGEPLKVGVLLPRSGVQALIGQDCQRAVELAPPILKRHRLARARYHEC
jgi:branched-chain amino acid transport system substrate-binding protein